MLVQVLITVILLNGICYSFEFESNQSNEQRNKSKNELNLNEQINEFFS